MRTYLLSLFCLANSSGFYRAHFAPSLATEEIVTPPAHTHYSSLLKRGYRLFIQVNVEHPISGHSFWKRTLIPLEEGDEYIEITTLHELKVGLAKQYPKHSILPVWLLRKHALETPCLVIYNKKRKLRFIPLPLGASFKLSKETTKGPRKKAKIYVTIWLDTPSRKERQSIPGKPLNNLPVGGDYREAHYTVITLFLPKKSGGRGESEQ